MPGVSKGMKHMSHWTRLPGALRGFARLLIAATFAIAPTAAFAGAIVVMRSLVHSLVHSPGTSIVRCSPRSGSYPLFAAILLAGAVGAQEIRYEIEFLDREAIEAPGMVLPAGGTLEPGGQARRYQISRNGRYVAGSVWDVEDPDPRAWTGFAFRLDRDTGAIDIFEELDSGPGGIGAVGVNDLGHLVWYARFGFSPDPVEVEMVFWAETTGAISFGPSDPTFVTESFSRRLLNNHDDVLLRPVPSQDEGGPTGGILWNPVLGTEHVVPHDSVEVNDRGVVIGTIHITPEASGRRPFAWTADEGIVLLPVPDEGSALVHGIAALGINDAGVILGGPRQQFHAALQWPDRFSEPLELPCPEFVPDVPSDCLASSIDASGRIYGGAAFADNEPGAELVWDGGVAYSIEDLLLDPDAACGLLQPTDLGELIAHCAIFDRDLPFPDSVVQRGPAILHPVFPDLRVTVTSPEEGSVVPEGQVLFEGTASDDIQIVSVTVDGIQAGLVATGNPEDPGEVSFTVSLLLCPGPRSVLVVATDNDGNSVSERRTIDVVPGETSCDGAPPQLDCSYSVASPATLWPPNHKLEPIEIVGIETADGSDATIHVTAVFQDEPVDWTGDGDTAPDAILDGSGGVSLRRERSGLGDGRIYQVDYETTDGSSSCTGSVIVGVPHDRGVGSIPVDSGNRYDSTSTGNP